MIGSRLREMVRKELRQMFRDRRTAPIIFVAPTIQLVIFGYAVNTDVRHTPVAVVDHDRTAASRALVDHLAAAGYFRVVARPDRAADLGIALDRGRATLALEIPPGFARSLATGRPAAVQVLVDGTSSNTATVAQGYARQIVQRFGEAAVRAHGATLPAGIDLRARAWFNPGLESRVYNVPAVAGVIIMLMCLLLTALAVVRERELGTLEQLMISPLTSAELIVGKITPVVLVGLVDLALVTGLAVGWFGIPLRGSVALLAGVGLLYILLGLGLGLLISTVSRTQQEAYMTMFLVFLPSMILSGFMFPVESMPRFFQVVTLANPLRHFLAVIRAIFLKGAGLDVLWPQVTVIGGLGTLTLAAAILRFRKRIG